VTPWLADWLRAFALTVLTETGVALPLLAAVEPRLARRAEAILLVNLASHPLVWFVGPALPLPYAQRLGISEAWALLAELGAYLVIWPALGARRAAIVSLCANGASFAVGVALRKLGFL
jgi:hypothetical protein